MISHRSDITYLATKIGFRALGPDLGSPSSLKNQLIARDYLHRLHRLPLKGLQRDLQGLGFKVTITENHTDAGITWKDIEGFYAGV